MSIFLWLLIYIVGGFLVATLAILLVEDFHPSDDPFWFLVILWPIIIFRLAGLLVEKYTARYYKYLMKKRDGEE